MLYMAIGIASQNWLNSVLYVTFWVLLLESIFIPHNSGAAVSITCKAEGTSEAEITFTKEDGSPYANDGVEVTHSSKAGITETMGGLCRT